MAIIKCPECGNNVSDRAENCIHCGCPLHSPQNSNIRNTATSPKVNLPQTPGNQHGHKNGKFLQNKKPKLSSRKWFVILMLFLFFPVGVVLLWRTNRFKVISKILLTVLLGLPFLFWLYVFYFVFFCPHTEWEPATYTTPKTCIACGETEGEPLKGADKEIAPYLEYIDDFCEDGIVYLSSELYDNKYDVEFMGMLGEVSFDVEDNYVYSCTWESVDGYTEDEFREIVTNLVSYFQSDAEKTSHTYVSGKTYRYYWIDPYNNLNVTYVHGSAFQNDFSYKEDGVITIIWESNETTRKNRVFLSDISNNEETADMNIGVVENIYTAADIPDELMNENFKNIVDLFSKGFSESGLDISNATTYDDSGTYYFYLEGLEFLEDECDDSHLQPRIIYSEDAIYNNGTPNEIFFGYYNPLKSNGYKETVEIIEDIAKALGISDSGLINNDYDSSSVWATGEYATFTFPNLNFKLIVSNSDGEVEIEIIPIE